MLLLMNQHQQQLHLHQQQQQQQQQQQHHQHHNFHQPPLPQGPTPPPHQPQPQALQPPVSVSISSMGEQTQPQGPILTQIHPQPQLSIQPQIQPQALIQTQSQPQSQSQTQTQVLPDNPPQLQHNTTIQAVEGTIAPAPSQLSKIPCRPRKTRKVTGDFSTTDNSENKATVAAVDGDNATLAPVTINKKNNIRGSKTTPTPTPTLTATFTSATITSTTIVDDNGNRIIVQPIRVIPRIVGKTLSCEGEVAAAIRHLRAVDPQLARVIDVHQPPSFDTFHPPFHALTKSILYQQLAYKAGTSIYTRFIALCGDAGVAPEVVLSLSLHQLRQIGVSARKASYLHDLASKYCKGILSDSSIIDMDDKSLFAMLTMVKGIGSWSVHMFMIFSLHRPDVLPVGDLGVRKGVQLLYGLEQLPRPSQMEQLCEKWKPYRSVGAWYMWRFAETKGAQASAAAIAVGASPPQLLQQQQHHQQPQQQQQQHQLLDPINGIASLGAIAWGQ